MPTQLFKTSEFSTEEIHYLSRTISQPRFARYLNACHGHDLIALSLYQWNLEISAAFFLPLQILEVALRNAVSEAIEAAYGPDWPHNQAFLISLRSSSGTFNPRQHLQGAAARHTVPSKVIADLNFIFWQKMFVSGHDDALWKPHLHSVFPNIDENKNTQQLRRELHDILETLRSLRNRIAHHEPIFERNLHHDLHLIDTLIGYRCQHTVNWMRRIEKVSKLLAHHPLAASGQVQSA